MKRAHVLLAGATTAALVSGLAYAGFRHLLEPVDEFSAANHPLEPWAGGTHLVVVPVLLFALGWVFGEHALARLAVRSPGRKSGLSLLATGSAMAFTGSILPLAGDGTFRAIVAWSHGASGVLFAISLALHAIASRRAARLAASSTRAPRARLPGGRLRRRATTQS